jgi:hypothetical protein
MEEQTNAYKKWDSIFFRKIGNGWEFMPSPSAFGVGAVDCDNVFFAKTLHEACDVIEEFRKKQ